MIHEYTRLMVFSKVTKCLVKQIKVMLLLYRVQIRKLSQPLMRKALESCLMVANMNVRG